MTLRHASLLAALAAIWGSSYLLIKYALEGFSPGEVVFIRATVAALVLWALLARQGDRAGDVRDDLRRRPGWALAFGAVGIAAPFLLISYGELEVPSGLTAVLIAPAPIFVAMLAPLLDDDERISSRQAAGLVVGLIGVGLVVGVDFVHSWIELLAALAVVGAASAYALAGYVVKRVYTGVPAIATSAISCSVGAALTLPVAAATAAGQVPGAGALAAALTLGVVHTALAIAILYHLIGQVGPGRANLVNYLIPGIALLYGAALRDEAVSPAALAGLALVLIGVGLASRRASASPGREAVPAGAGARGGRPS